LALRGIRRRVFLQSKPTLGDPLKLDEQLSALLVTEPLNGKPPGKEDCALVVAVGSTP
jgi:hypothetical protein